MKSKIKHILKSYIYWKSLKRKLGIDYKKVVLVLSGENESLDISCIIHLKDFMTRKYADSAIIILIQGRSIHMPDNIEAEKINKWEISREQMELLYDLYCFYKFFDNIVFTYTDRPVDNLLGRYLRETNINEEEAACLALYHLRSIPKVNF